MTNYWMDSSQEFAQNRIDSRQYILLPRIGEIIRDFPIKSVLDFGCGEGYLSRFIDNKETRIGLHDISPDMLVLARENLRVAGLHNVEVYRSINQIPSGEFDCVVVSLVLMTISSDNDYLSVLKTCRNSLTSSGKLIIGITHPCFRASLFSTQHTKFTLGHSFDYFAAHEPFEVYLRTSKAETFIKFEDYHHNLSYMFSMFARAGLKVVSLEELKDTSIESSYFNETASPYMIIVCEKT